MDTQTIIYDTSRETLARVKRTEVRVSNLMKFMGFDPRHDYRKGQTHRVVVQGGEVHALTPDVSLGEAMQAAYDAHLSGPVALYLMGTQLAMLEL